MRYPAYPKYRDSGVDWLGEIPEGWKVNRLHDILTIKTSNVDKKTVEGQESVKLCNYVDVYYNNNITEELTYMVASASKEDIQKFSLKKDDVIITKDSESPFDIGIPAYVPDDVDDLVCGYHLSILRSNRLSLSGAFLFYSLTAKNSVYQFTLAANGVTRFGLTTNGTKNIIIPVPSISEQKAIAEFLDKKTSQIDALIQKKKELIEKLKEQRMALITKVVTKGLDDSVPMKDSGVDWLGEIPEGWEVIALKRKMMILNGSTPKSSESENWDGDIIWVTPADLSKTDQKFVYDSQRKITIDGLNSCGTKLVPIKSIILSTRAPIGTVALSAVELCTNQGCKSLVKDSADIYEDYIYYQILISEVQLNALGSGTTFMELSYDSLSMYKIVIPPLSEQKAIAEFLDSKTSQIDALIKKAEEVIEKLKEYRMTLITDTVTGKINV